MADRIGGELVDGAHVLYGREKPRLWYRALPAVRPMASSVPGPTLRTEPEHRIATATAPENVVRLPENVPVSEAKAETTASATLAEWRTAPAGAPSLLLSANDLLDVRVSGPVLGPGCLYRIVDVQNGVVGLEVRSSDAQQALGYCAAVDLVCIDARLASKKPVRPWTAPMNAAKLKVRRISQGGIQVTQFRPGAPASSQGPRPT